MSHPARGRCSVEGPQPRSPIGPWLRPSSLAYAMTASGSAFFAAVTVPPTSPAREPPPPPVPTRPEINNRVTRKLRRFDSSECDKKKSITRLLSPSLPRDPDERKARRDGGRRARGNRGGEGVTGGGALIQSNVSD